MKNHQKTQMNWTIAIVACLAYVIAMGIYVEGVPSGATATNLSTDTGPTITPDNRSDDGGTITYLNLNSVQQNPGWKAYVGNVTGTLTLDDANQNTIYDWNIATITGEVYVSRDNSVGWGAITCAQAASIATEQTFLGGVAADSDSINSTYNYTVHDAMQVGVNSIAQSSCPTTYTHVSDAFPASPGLGTDFTAILLEDAGNDIVYATFIENDVTSFAGGTSDYQIIIPDNSTGVINTYYFYLELGS